MTRLPTSIAVLLRTDLARHASAGTPSSSDNGRSGTGTAAKFCRLLRRESLFRIKRPRNIVIGILFILLAGSCARRSNAPLLIGVGRIASITYFDERRQASGFGVDVINEAARREGITVRWVPLVKGVVDDLQSGTVDLLAAGMGTDERRQKLYVSDPWWYQELSLLTRAAQVLPPRRLGLQQVYVEFARPDYDPATFFVDPPNTSGAAANEAKAVCAGTLDGALITHGELHDIFLNRPAECTGVQLQSVDTAVAYGLSIISRKSDEAISKRLRKRIDDLILDGTLLRFAAAHPPMSISGAIHLQERIQHEYENRIAVISACGLAFLLVFLLWFFWDGQRKRAERKYRGLLEAAPDAMIVVNRHGRIVLVNAQTERMFGYMRGELPSRKVEDLVPLPRAGEHPEASVDYWKSVRIRPMGLGLDLFAYRKDGTRFPVDVSLNPVDSGGDGEVIAAIRDITARKAAEQEIRAISERFTAELTAINQQLELRNREVERANRLKSEFLATMSHELRTPLHTILGFSDLLNDELEGPLNEKQRRFVGHIYNDGQHLLHLINEILDLSKIEAGRLELHPETVDAANAVEEVLTSIRPLGVQKGIVVENRLETTVHLPGTLDQPGCKGAGISGRDHLVSLPSLLSSYTAADSLGELAQAVAEWCPLR